MFHKNSSVINSIYSGQLYFSYSSLSLFINEIMLALLKTVFSWWRLELKKLRTFYPHWRTNTTPTWTRTTWTRRSWSIRCVAIKNGFSSSMTAKQISRSDLDFLHFFFHSSNQYSFNGVTFTEMTTKTNFLSVKSMIQNEMRQYEIKKYKLTLV